MKTLPLALLALPLAACLENEEEIVVERDGSVQVTVSVSGDVGDLADGYPVPLDRAWTPENSDTRRWLETVGPDTGTAATRARLAEVGWPAEGDDSPQADLVVSASFPSVESMPRQWSSPEDPYASAYLERETTLATVEHDGRTVYVFERTYRGRDRERFDALALAEEGLEGEKIPQEILKRLDEDEPVTREEFAPVAEAIGQGYRLAAEFYVRDAIGRLYTEGDASLAGKSAQIVRTRAGEAVAAVVSPAQLLAIYTLSLEDNGDKAAGKAFEAMEERARQAMRDTLRTALFEEGLEAEIVHGVLFGLEHAFTRVDHSDDLRDEGYELKVTLPGVLVGGNHLSEDGSTAEWTFTAADFENDLVLRAVSVLEG